MAIFAAMVAACSYEAGVGGGAGVGVGSRTSTAFPVGSTAERVRFGLGPEERVLFQDDKLMIVDGPSGRRRYELDDGRVKGVYPD